MSKEKREKAPEKYFIDMAISIFQVGKIGGAQYPPYTS